jgi:hypothetical protein
LERIVQASNSPICSIGPLDVAAKERREADPCNRAGKLRQSESVVLSY